MAIDKFLVEASHIMMFARSIGDDNPVYYDEDHKSESGSAVSYKHLKLPTKAWCRSRWSPYH